MLKDCFVPWGTREVKLAEKMGKLLCQRYVIITVFVEARIPLFRLWECQAKEAVTAVMEWAEKEYSPKYFFACCDQRNEESRRLCERLNMKFNESRFAHGREEYEYRTIAKNI